MTFADLGLSDELLKAVAEAGYETPTPIQAQAIPPVLMMRDLIGIAQTGTGKTASFVLPMIDILAQGRSRARMPRSLILEPTRELAAQVAENFEQYGKYNKLSMALLIGGVSMGDQVKALEKGVDVLIATPGRLMDLFERGNILLTGCSMLVIDEADRMLDMGFVPDIENICSKLPANRQTLLFSATMPPPIKKLADKFLTNPKSVEVARPATASANITQWLVKVDARKKREKLRHLLKAEKVANAIIFCNRKSTVRELNKSLQSYGFASGEIHGDIDQAARVAELDRFKNGEVHILVASDVAARGLDIKGVSHVFNFDAPWHPDDYVHRIGRTGRAGAKGVAYTFVAKDDAEAIDNIQKLIGTTIAYAPGEGGGAPADAAEDAPEATERKRGGKDAKKDRDRPAEGRSRRRKGGAREGAREAEAADSVAEAPVEAREAPVRESSARETHAREGRKEERAPRYGRPSDERRDRPERTERKPEPRRADRNAPDDGPDEGWNGPVPEFLAVGFSDIAL